MIALDVRTGRIAVLGAWAAFLGWLIVDGQVPRYLGPRTAWIVPVGAATLTLAALAYARFTVASESARRPLRRREGLALAAVLAPALVALCLADATLGSLAAANKLGSRGIDASKLAGSLRSGSDKIDFLLVRGADEDPKLARQRGIEPGAAVTLKGFVYKTGAPLRLARFYITCCVADSVAIDVPVYGLTGTYKRDTWLQVTGVLDKRKGHLAVVDAKATRIGHPKHPYLVFRV